jgi:heme exporter protein C
MGILNFALMNNTKKSSFLSWWKILTILLLIYSVVGGFMFEVPRIAIGGLHETIRNLYFHVPMWFGMIILLLVSVIYSILYLRTAKTQYDTFALEAANTGMLFGILGLLTGMLWAQFTWGKFWSGDPKQNATAIGMLIYCAYFILRGSFTDDQMRARVSAIYNILSYPVFIALIFVLPRLADSLHPGNGGNPGFNAYDLNAGMRLVFYPAVIGFTLLGVWITTLRVRIKNIENTINKIN